MSDMKSVVIQRILKYAQVPKNVVESQESRAIFNDIQLILSCNHTSDKYNHDHPWNPTVEEDIIRVRNLMNVTQRLLVNREWKGR